MQKNKNCDQENLLLFIKFDFSTIYLFIFIYSSRTRWLWPMTVARVVYFRGRRVPPNISWSCGVLLGLRAAVIASQLNVNRYCIYAACLIMPVAALIPSLNSVNNNIHSSRVTYNCWCLTKSFDIVVERLSTSYNGVILVVPD